MKSSSKFRRWLYDNGMLINDFAELLKVHRTLIWRWQIGRFRPGTKTMNKIRALTNGYLTKPEDLLDTEN